MTPIDRFERSLPTALTDLADPRTPDYFTDILGLTARSRQRPAWASIERWLPMDLASTTRPFRDARWRPLGVLALIGILLATALAVYIGSRPSDRPDLPAPFGLAANGTIVYMADGDLFAGDPVAGESTALLSGASYDYDAGYSRDGTRIAFWRRVTPTDASADFLMVMDADGTDPRPVRAEPFQHVDWWDWAPDGQSLIVAHAPDGTNIIESYDAVGGQAPRRLTEGIDAREPAFRPPDGAEILFRGATAEGIRLYVVGADGTNLRPITAAVAPTATYDMRQPRYSPDGSRIAYQSWDAVNGVMRLYVIGADGSDRREVLGDSGTYFLAWPVWSNDGGRIVAHRVRDKPDGGRDSSYVVIDLETGAVTPTGPGLPEDGGLIEWAPDDSKLLMVPSEDGGRQLLLDPDGGSWTEVPWDSASYPNWQRTAD